MAKRIKIGLNFFFDNQTNSGIVNYIYNIISALNTLNEEKKPELIIYYSINAPVEYIKEINYPKIQYILFKPYSSIWIIRKINGIIRKITNRDIYLYENFLKKIDCLFPYFEFKDHSFKGAKNKIHWLVDFNNKVFPNHYIDKGETMSNYQSKISREKNRVVLSSESLLNELKYYFPGYKCEIKILRFASSLKLNYQKQNPIVSKYVNNTIYFMSPNQFWEHKNQSIVMDAISFIKKNKPDLKFKVLFSGSLQVNRGKGQYIDQLAEKVKSLDISEYTEFLGVLERNDQLLLMHNSRALIQPSLYEGWSTLVEESKALHKLIILSDLPVHREQINENVDFFDPYNAVELGSIMLNHLENIKPIIYKNYEIEISNYAERLLEAFTF